MLSGIMLSLITYLHVMTVHEAMYNLLQEEARLGLSKALALPYIIQQGSPLCQFHHLDIRYLQCTFIFIFIVSVTFKQPTDSQQHQVLVILWCHNCAHNSLYALYIA